MQLKYLGAGMGPIINVLYAAIVAAALGLCYLAFWLGGRVTVGEGDVARVPRSTYVTPASVPATAEGTPVVVDHCMILRGDEVTVVEEGDELVLLAYRHVIPASAPYRCPDGARFITHKLHFASMDEDYEKETALDEERKRLLRSVANAP